LTGKKVEVRSRAVGLLAGLAVSTVATANSTRMREAMALNGLMRETAAALDGTRELVSEAAREAVARDARQAAQTHRLYLVAKLTLAAAIATLVVAVIAPASQSSSASVALLSLVGASDTAPGRPAGCSYPRG
jgi:hypothetical protein